MKPLFYLNVHDDGSILEVSTKYPTEPPKLGGVWTTYFPANTHLESVLAENEELKAQNKQLRQEAWDE